MKAGFDIGGVISRYPKQMKELMKALIRGGVEVCILTDMNSKDAMNAVMENGFDFIYPDHIHSCDWSGHGDLCKTEVAARIGIDILIDDRPDYCASGDFIGLVLSPRPDVPYYHESWINKPTSVLVVSSKDYDEFQAWKAQQKSSD